MKRIVFLMCTLLMIGSVQVHAKGINKESKAHLIKAQRFGKKDEYVKAVTEAALAVKSDLNNTKAIKYLLKSFKTQQKKEAASLIKANKGDDAVVKSFYLFDELCKMYDTLKDLPPIKTKKDPELVLPTKDYHKQLDENRELAANYYYQKGMNLIHSNEVDDLKKAVDNLSKIEKISPNYKNYKEESNQILKDKADQLLAGGRRLDKITAATIYDKLFFKTEGFDLASYKREAKKLYQEGVVNIYFPNALKSDLRDLRLDKKYQIYLRDFLFVHDPSLRKDALNKLDALSKENVNAVCVLKNLELADFKKSEIKVVERKKYEACIHYNLLVNGDRGKQKSIVYQDDKLAWPLVNSVRKDGKSYNKKEFQFITCNLGKQQVVVSCNYKAQYTLVDTKTGNELCSFDVNKPHKESYENYVLMSGNDKAVPKKMRLNKVDLSKVGNQAVIKKNIKKKLLVDIKDDFKRKVLELYP